MLSLSFSLVVRTGSLLVEQRVKHEGPTLDIVWGAKRRHAQKKSLRTSARSNSRGDSRQVRYQNRMASAKIRDHLREQLPKQEMGGDPPIDFCGHGFLRRYPKEKHNFRGPKKAKKHHPIAVN